MRFVVRCIEFLTCHDIVPRRCFILPKHNYSGVSDAVLLAIIPYSNIFRPTSCTSGHVEFDLVRDAVKLRRVEAVVAQVYRRHSCGSGRRRHIGR